MLKKYSLLFLAAIPSLIKKGISGAVISIVCISPTSALLGEDLGLDLYRQIDEGFYELERAQYEYELSGQGEASVAEVIGPILADQGLECDINSVDEIEEALGNGVTDQIPFIVQRCSRDGESMSNEVVERIIGQMEYIKNSFRERAINKANTTFDVAKIGLYSDGSTENSPFDLMDDLREIDRIIFSEDIEYEGVPYDLSSDEALEEYLEAGRQDTYEDSRSNAPEDSSEEGDETGSEEDSTEPTIPDFLNGIIDDHNYVCLPGEDTSGLDPDDLDDIVSDISGGGSSGGGSPFISTYSGGIVSNGTSWGGPFAASGPAGSYSDVRDDWNCDEVFCITIEFQRSNYGLTGGRSGAIETILSKAADHLEKPANASLTQRKMTTNNFEISSIIRDLPGMLRGFGIEIQTKPVPILDVPSDNEDSVEGDIFEIENLLSAYYKNGGLDYERRNDLDIYEGFALETKILQTSGGMPINYVEQRGRELQKFRDALRENNRQISLEVDKKVISDDMRDFADQFTELERFVAAIEDFSKSVVGSIGQMQEIPTRSP